MIIGRLVVTWLVQALLAVLAKALGKPSIEKIVAKVVFRALRYLAGLTKTDLDEQIVGIMEDSFYGDDNRGSPRD